MSERHDDHANQPVNPVDLVRMYTWRAMQGSGAMRFILGPCVGVSVYYAPGQQAFMGHIPLASQPTGRKILEELVSAAQSVVGEQGTGARVWIGGAMNSPANGVRTDADRQATLEVIGQMLPGADVTVHWQDAPDHFTDYTLDVATGHENIEEGPADLNEL